MTTPAVPWHHQPMLALDTETTGPEPLDARIVTAAAVWINPVAGAVTTTTWLADPGVLIPVEAAEIHGITTAQAQQEGRPAGDVVAEVCQVVADAWAADAPVVAFNAAYDLTVLACEAARHGVPFTADGPVVDPLVLDRALVQKRRGKRRLPDLCGHYGITLSDDDAHTAGGDALAAARLAWRIAAANPSVTELDLAALHTYQTRAHRAWAEEFETWLRDRKARDGATDEEVAAVVIERDWPLRITQEATPA